MKKSIITLTVMLAAAALVIVFCGSAMAKVKGRCDNCHTMHNSQNGDPMAYQLNSGHSDYEDDATANGALLITNCLGCHSHGTQTAVYEQPGGCKVPVVYYIGGSAPSEYLAGGNFWWVKRGVNKGNDDSAGHNVFLGETDVELPPAEGAPGATGYVLNCGTNCCHNTLAGVVSGSFPEIDGHQGCDGCHLNVRHHADDHPNFQGGLVTTADQGWYRFLSAHLYLNSGVEGYEDGDWQATQGMTDHNEYRGSEAGNRGLGNYPTTTAFCTGCHGLFHEQEESGNWVRHPSDAKLCPDGTIGCECADYTQYNPLAPVGRESLPSPPSGVVDPENDLVMCLSCHRPHGSPYPDLLRWQYIGTPAGGCEAGDTSGGCGCFVCHTQKGTYGTP